MNNNSKSNTEKIKFICLPGGGTSSVVFYKWFGKLNEKYRPNNLNISDATSEDNYYFSGGDSLKAIKLSSEINKIFNLEFTTMELLETQTLGELFNKIYPLISYKGESK